MIIIRGLILFLLSRSGNSLLNRRRRKIRPAIGIPSVPVINEEPAHHGHGELKSTNEHNASAATITVTAANPSAASPKKERNNQNNANNATGAKNRKNPSKLPTNDRPSSAATGNTVTSSAAPKTDSMAKNNNKDDGWSTVGPKNK